MRPITFSYYESAKSKEWKWDSEIFFVTSLIIDALPSIDGFTPGSGTEEGSSAMWFTNSSSGVWPCGHLTVAAKPGNREELPHFKLSQCKSTVSDPRHLVFHSCRTTRDGTETDVFCSCWQAGTLLFGWHLVLDWYLLWWVLLSKRELVIILIFFFEKNMLPLLQEMICCSIKLPVFLIFCPHEHMYTCIQTHTHAPSILSGNLRLVDMITSGPRCLSDRLQTWANSNWITKNKIENIKGKSAAEKKLQTIR